MSWYVGNHEQPTDCRLARNAYVISEQLLTQLGTQFKLYPALVAAAPNGLFLGLALFLLLRGRSVAA